MKNASDIVETVGVRAIAQRMDITEDAVHRAKRAGKLPASWFKALCDMTGETLPEGAFTFKGLDA